MANIELDGANKKIKVDSGDLTLDVPGDIILDADGADLVFADGGTNILKVTNSSSDVVFQPQVDAKDIIFKQYDGTTVATVEDNATFNIPASKLAIGGTAVTSTAAELNLLDGGTSVGGSITLADGDGVVVNDGGTMKTIPASDVKTYAGGAITALNNATANELVTVGSTTTELDAEANLTFDGAQLSILDSDAGTENLLVKTTGDNQISMGFEKSDCKFDVGLDHNNDGSQNFFIRERHLGSSNTNNVRMMIDSSGNVIIGGTSPDLSGADRRFAVQGGDEYTAGFRGQGTSKEVVVIHNQTSGSSDRYMIEFKTGGGGGSGVGSVRSNSSSTAFNTSSDYRLKENEVAISDGITRLKQLKPYKFNFKIDTDKIVDGFFAHEVSSIVPEAISGEKDAVKEDGTIIPQQIDQAKLVPLLTASLKEAITKIETLETEMTALKARVKTLEDA